MFYNIILFIILLNKKKFCFKIIHKKIQLIKIELLTY